LPRLALAQLRLERGERLARVEQQRQQLLHVIGVEAVGEQSLDERGEHAGGGVDGVTELDGGAVEGAEEVDAAGGQRQRRGNSAESRLISPSAASRVGNCRASGRSAVSVSSLRVAWAGRLIGCPPCSEG